MKMESAKDKKKPTVLMSLTPASVTVILCLPSPSVLHTAFGLVAAPGVSRHSTRLPTTHPVHPSARATRPLSSGPFATRNPAPGALLTTLPSVVGSEALRG